jgi:hypothetical protein
MHNAFKKESRPKKSGPGIQLFVNPKVKMSLRIIHRIDSLKKYSLFR